MGSKTQKISFKARREFSRRAFSLLEIAVVIAILGVLTLAAIQRYGNTTIATGGAEGLTRKIALSLTHARRGAIASGDNHFVQFNSSSGSIVSFSTLRRSGGGNVTVDQTYSVPQDVTVTSASSTLEFTFEGSALSGYTVNIAGPDRTWQVSVVALTGAVQVVETTL